MNGMGDNVNQDCSHKKTYCPWIHVSKTQTYNCYKQLILEETRISK